MSRPGRGPLEKLARFRRLSEDKAAAALQAAARTSAEAAESLERAVHGRDAVTEWKAGISAESGIPLDFYAHSLELEAQASEIVERVRVLNRHAAESKDAAMTGYQSALNAVRVVERRSERRAQDEWSSIERAGSDLVSDLWLARRLHDNA